MACIAAIGVDDEENIRAGLADRLHPNFAVISTLISVLESGTQKDTRSVIEVETTLAQRALALGLVPPEEHCWAKYTL